MYTPCMLRRQGARLPQGSLSFFVRELAVIRTYVYIDGFNLYYRALRGKPYRWLNVRKLASLLLPEDEIVRIDTSLLKYLFVLVTRRKPSVKKRTYVLSRRSRACQFITGTFLPRPR